MTLQDALESMSAEIEVVKSTWELPSSELCSDLDAAEKYQTSDLMKNSLTSTGLSADAQHKPLPLKFNGAFSVIVFNNERCLFRKYCSNKSCLVKFARWTIKSFPFSCGLFYTTNDYIKVNRLETV